MALVNPAVDLRFVAAPLEADDEQLDVFQMRQLRHVALFQGMKPGPDKFPGAIVLRRCSRGRVLFRQGDAGQTAFLFLTNSEALQVLRAMALGTLARREAEAHITGVSGKPSAFSAAPHAVTGLSSDFARGTRSAAHVLAELQRLEGLVTEGNSPLRSGHPAVAEARLVTSHASVAAPSGRWQRLVAAIRRPFGGEAKKPDLRAIPSECPEDFSAVSSVVSLNAGDLCGESSCLHFAPRASTVVLTAGDADEPVYVLEIMRHVLEALRRSVNFQARLDETYRQRTMEVQFRALPVFSSLTSEDYAWLAPRVELQSFPEGAILQDEHQAVVEHCFLIRNGVVRVMRDLGCLLGPRDILHPHRLLQCLESSRQATGLGASLFAELSIDVRKLVERSSGAAATLSRSELEQLRTGLNDWIRSSRLADTVATSTSAGGDEAAEPVIANRESRRPGSNSDSQTIRGPLDYRIWNRLQLEWLCPGCLVERAATASRQRTLEYRSRGELIGDECVFRGEESRTHCAVYVHQATDASGVGAERLVTQRLDVVRIPAEVLRQLAARSTAFRRGLQSTAATAVPVPDNTANRAGLAAVDTADFHSLGLAWGQSLMVIDLDRCTRCSECVRACVDAHEDGRTRLHLDGPRFEERYLIPTTCRGCLDPVCMIGCPVGAIHRGQRGEIWISDHCIGCSRCADQCPYGSIQMELVQPESSHARSDRSASGPGFTESPIHETAVVCDQCRFTHSGQPACLYACPHDATFRVLGSQFLKGIS